MTETEVTPDQQMKLLYSHRPWENEPDNAEWYDASTGYKCRIQRQTENSGTLCGYVGVFKGHPAWGGMYQGYPHIEVHGGLTFSDTDKNAVHWFGFDTAHARDFCPGIALRIIKARKKFKDDPNWDGWESIAAKNETYRTWEYVEGEVRKLVDALWKIERLAMLGEDHE